MSSSGFKAKFAALGEVRLFERLSTQEKINFARHLSMIVKAGLPVYQGLTIIRSQTSSKTLAHVIDQLMTDVNNGRFLADSLEQFHGIFGDFFINIIRVGETSGTLAQNLLYLSEELKKSKKLESKIRSAMVYPAVVLIATVCITAFLTFFIFPKLLGVFSGLNVTLPAATRAVIVGVDFLRNYGGWLLLSIILLVIIFRVLRRYVYHFRYALHRIIFFVPVVSGLTVAINATNFARVLSLLLRSGVKIVEALSITSDTFENEVYRRSVLRSTEELKKGGQLADFLMREPQFFPTLLSGMVRVGENTGNLEENLSYVAEYFNEEVENKLQTLTSLLEPFLLLFMGLLVGFVAVSIILPIYQLSSAVG